MGPVTPSSVSSSTHSGARVLCLEDDVTVSRALERTLQGYVVDLVSTVAEAKTKIESGSYDAWLLDVRVPDGSGLDVLAWARLRGDRTPALVMTGLLDHVHANSAQILGAEFVYKPYGKAHLDSFLERATRPAETPLPSRNADAFVREHKLTKREGEIIHAIARGVPRGDLAAQLGVAESTVKTLIHRLLERAGYANLDEVLRDLLRRA